MRKLIVIPARLGSWRFPNKPLIDILGIPMIEHVYRRAQMAKQIDEVVIATCDEEIAKAAQKFGAPVVMTSKECPTACERVGEAAAIKGYTGKNDIVINVQGDEPAVPPQVIELTIERLLQNDNYELANLVETLKDSTELENPHRVKAILSVNDNLLYLSRVAVPSTLFDVQKRAKFYLLTCITAYRGTFLTKYKNLSRSPVELIEGNDMMRTLEHEILVPSGISPYHTHPVDTPEDVDSVITILRNDSLTKKYVTNL